MKVAFLILVHDRPDQLERLVRALKGMGTCFIHVDAGTAIEPFQQRLASLPANFSLQRFNIRWSGYEMVDATLELAKLALSHAHYDYFVLLSGSDYPIKSDAHILQTLAKGGEFLETREMPHLGHPLSRLDFYFFAPKNRRSLLFRILNRLIQFGPKRPWRRTVLAGMVARSGSQWWAFSEACMSHLVRFAEANPHFMAYFRRSRTPDEMIFQTIVGASPFAGHIKPPVTFAEWKRPSPPHPATLYSADFALLQARPELFARKFDLAADPEIFDRIDAELRA